MKSNLKPNYLFSVPLYVLDPKKKVKWINCPSFTVLNIILGCPTLWNLVIRSRFNHSCCANVAYVWNQELQSVEYRALHEIKLGEELCINYMPSSLFMKNLQTRQHCLLLTWGFSCVCRLGVSIRWFWIPAFSKIALIKIFVTSKKRILQFSNSRI